VTGVYKSPPAARGSQSSRLPCVKRARKTYCRRFRPASPCWPSRPRGLARLRAACYGGTSEVVEGFPKGEPADAVEASFEGRLAQLRFSQPAGAQAFASIGERSGRVTMPRLQSGSTIPLRSLSADRRGTRPCAPNDVRLESVAQPGLRPRQAPAWTGKFETIYVLRSMLPRKARHDARPCYKAVRECADSPTALQHEDLICSGCKPPRPREGTCTQWRRRT
jgi:hypothetical protein